MTRPTWLWAVLGLGWLMSAAPAAGQVPPAPRPNARAELGPLTQAMAGHARKLAEEIGSNLAQNPTAGGLAQEAQELALSLEEYSATVPNAPDPFQLRRTYKGIDQSWHRLQGQLAQAEFALPPVARAAARVAEVDARIHQELGLNAYPANYFTSPKPLAGLNETQRLAHALVDRAQSFAAVVRADMVGAGGARLVQDAMNLAVRADDYHDGIDLGANPAVAQNGFPGVELASEAVRTDLAGLPPPVSPRVLAAWRTYLSVEVLLRRNLGLPNVPENLAGTALAVANGPSPVVALADLLVGQVNDFLQVWTATARNVPEGAFFLADARQLQAAAADFRLQAQRETETGALAYQFRNLDLIWQRLARRTNRVARGRTGPNIQQVGKMGQTIAELHRLLGVPGYPAVVAPPTVVVVPGG